MAFFNEMSLMSTNTRQTMQIILKLCMMAELQLRPSTLVCVLWLECVPLFSCSTSCIHQKNQKAVEGCHETGNTADCFVQWADRYCVRGWRHNTVIAIGSLLIRPTTFCFEISLLLLVWFSLVSLWRLGLCLALEEAQRPFVPPYLPSVWGGRGE